MVFKLSVGAGSANVLKINGYDEAAEVIRRMFDTGFFPWTVNEGRIDRNIFRDRKAFKHFLERTAHAAQYVFNQEYPPLRKRWWKPEFDYAAQAFVVVSQQYPEGHSFLLMQR